LSDALVTRRLVLGYSVQHRPIVAFHIGDPDNPRRILVVGCIHGSEPAGIAITTALIHSAPVAEVDLWVVPVLNPDGVNSNHRGNARGVDLNRNFPYRWRPLGRPGDLHYAGPRALSEPESQAGAALINRVRPTLGIWYHQALAVVDDSEGPIALERRYASEAGLPLSALPDYPGSAVGYENHLLGPTAFVVELPGGVLSRTDVLRHRRAIIRIATLSA
jgi:protein MpaA